MRSDRLKLHDDRMRRFVNGLDRAELQRYLELRGFGVYDSEDSEDLREALFLDLAGEDDMPDRKPDPHWLDKVIEEQRAIQGDEVMDLISGAAEAEDLISYEELERDSRRRR